MNSGITSIGSIFKDFCNRQNISLHSINYMFDGDLAAIEFSLRGNNCFYLLQNTGQGKGSSFTEWLIIYPLEPGKGTGGKGKLHPEVSWFIKKRPIAEQRSELMMIWSLLGCLVLGERSQMSWKLQPPLCSCSGASASYQPPGPGALLTQSIDFLYNSTGHTLLQRAVPVGEGHLDQTHLHTAQLTLGFGIWQAIQSHFSAITHICQNLPDSRLPDHTKDI